MKRLFFLVLVSAVSFNCQKEISDPGGNALLPTLTTTVVSAITPTTAVSGGTISSDGGAAVTERGVCWGTATNPVVTGNHTTDGAGVGTFTSNITGLAASTTYFVRAYATNSTGTAYGNEVSFTTTATGGAVLPTLTTTNVTAITTTTASSGGNISSDGGAAVTARGVCWSTTANPVVAGNHTTDGTGIGTFTSNITALNPSTTYFVRAYATNSVGTAYGNELSFTTSAAAVDVYVAGYEISGSVSVAKVWKNGVGTPISSGPNDAIASSIYVSGTDVYAGGYEDPPTGAIPMLWKNGVGSPLPVATASKGWVSSVAVSGTDVYVAGTEETSPVITTTARLWKNGISVPLGIMPGATSSAISVFVSGTDVYVAGYEATTQQYATIWKNGVSAHLTSSTATAVINSVFISGTDVYAVGADGPSLTVWKNGVPSNIVTANTADGYSIFVSGSDVYIVGREYNGSFNVARLWKNGVATSLSSGTSDAGAESVYVKGTDVYIVGWQNNGTKDVAMLWKNGVAVPLTTGTTDAYAGGVFVK